MLVLQRLRTESIMIGDDIEVEIVDIRGDKVRLGITAPTSIPVHRREVYLAIKRENAIRTTARDQAEAADLPLADRPACPQGRPAQPGTKGN